MKTRKRKPLAFGADSAPDVPKLNVNSQEIHPNEEEKPNRVSFFVTPNGTPDFSRMLDKTKNQLAELLRNKDVQKELGITTDEVKKIEEIGFGEDEANALLDAISGIDSFAASRIYKIPREVTSVAFQFTPDHRKKINPPLTRIMNKWGPAILKTWKDEIGLGIVLLSVLNAQTTLMHILETRRQRSLQTPPAPSKVTNISAAPPVPPKEEKSVDKEPSATDAIALDA